MNNLKLMSIVVAACCTLSLIKSQPCLNRMAIICASIKNESWTIADFLTCNGVESISTTYSNARVILVEHSNGSEVTNISEIPALNIQHASVKFIPFGIKAKFINLKLLQISSCGLLSVSKENLKEFGSSLELLSLDYNKLISIDDDLFEYNSNLKAIYLYSNPLRFIGPDFLKNLQRYKTLQYIDLEFSGCISQVFSTGYDRDNAIWKWTNEKCSDFSAKLEMQKLTKGTICSHAEINNEIILN